MLALLILALPAAVLAWTLRKSAVPGGPTAAAITAGIFIGLLAGPGVLGRGWPDLHERLFLGGTAESAAIRERALRHADELAALRAAGVTPAAIDEHLERQRAELDPLLAARDSARAAHRARFNWAIHALLALHLFLIAPSLTPPPFPAGGRRPKKGTPATWASVVWASRPSPVVWASRPSPVVWASRPYLLIPTCATLLSLTPPFLLSLWPVGLPIMEAAALALILGAPGISAALRRPFFTPVLLSFTPCMFLALSLAPTPFTVLVPIGLIGGMLTAHWFAAGGDRPRVRRAFSAFTHALTLPALAAAAALPLDLLALHRGPDAFAFYAALILALLWASDGRWLAWCLALRIAPPPFPGGGRGPGGGTPVVWASRPSPEVWASRPSPEVWASRPVVWASRPYQPNQRPPHWTLAAQPVNAGAGVVSLIFILIFTPAGLTTGPLLAAGLFAAAYVELTRGARAWLAHVLDRSPPPSGRGPGRGDESSSR